MEKKDILSFDNIFYFILSGNIFYINYFSKFKDNFDKRK
jgi:hypothetical protein